MRLLLDTHIFLWWWSGDRKLSGATRRLIGRAEEVFVSAASAWEIVIKAALGKLRFEGEIGEAVEACQFTELPIATRHAEALRKLARYHSDPFDRMLIAQAKVEFLTIVTLDQAFKMYPVTILLT
ncbi:MAG TPA: type II toxin-antitoxin system VapC family toxin [Candidatus Binataceae bacterium]|nr:type II toxin-antitoxin system VapC family toxin [Candidatus Binataceae bacterium]